VTSPTPKLNHTQGCNISKREAGVRLTVACLAAVDLECPWRVSVDGMEFPPRSDQRVQVFHPATVSQLTLR
jgi:hypothetical protein